MEEKSYFKIAEKRILPFLLVPSESKGDVKVQVTLDISLDMGFSQRMLYRFVDLLSDLGGFAIAIFSFTSAISYLTSYSFMENDLVQQLYNHLPTTKRKMMKHTDYHNKFLNQKNNSTSQEKSQQPSGSLALKVVMNRRKVSICKSLCLDKLPCGKKCFLKYFSESK